MRLTVLGSAASYAGPGRACAGYLVQTSTTNLLVDCGNGVISNLSEVFEPSRLDAVFITHGHPDHFVDLYCLQALLRYAPEGPAAPVSLHVPAGLFERATCLLSDRGAEELGAAFEVTEHEHGVPCLVGDVEVTPMRVKHTNGTFALRIAGDGVLLAFTADTMNGDSALEAVRGADLLLAEATLPDLYEDAAPHLTARQAGHLARAAGARALVLTHIWPTNDRQLSADEASEAFDGPVTVAEELEVYEIAPDGREEGSE